jgi:glycosyltransferase involved in cell wall biosynthesis
VAIAQTINAGGLRSLLAKRSVAEARRVLFDLRFPLPKLRTAAVQRTVPTVYFCAPDYDIPAGGLRVTYRHVDLLNDAGISAAVLHHRAGFRCTWFEHETRVVGDRDTVIGPDDLVVVSELATSLLDDLGPRNRFVVFNQNPHLMWEQAPEHEVIGYMRDPRLAAILVVSDHSLEMVRYAAPSAHAVRLHNSIDPARFFTDGRDPGRVLSYMSRRGLHEAEQALGLLRGHGALDGWEVRRLEGLSENQVAAQLRATTIFLSLAYHEGFGLPAAEAMACGAYAVGFHGFSGREYFRPEFSHPVEPGDVLGLARAVAEVIERERLEPGWCQTRGSAASRFVAESYSPDRERRDVVETYSALLAR